MLFSTPLFILAAASSVFAGVISASNQTEASNKLVAAADSISSLPTKAVRCGGTSLPSKCPNPSSHSLGNLPRHEIFATKDIKAAAEASLNHLIGNTQVGS